MARNAFGALSWEKCRALIASGRTGKACKVAPNTYIEEQADCDGPAYLLKLHGNTIIIFRRNGSVTYYARGYRTVTTKERLNSFGPVSVYQSKREWFAGDEPFRDGMEVGSPVFADTVEVLEYAMLNGDEVARAALRDMREEGSLA